MATIESLRRDQALLSEILERALGGMRSTLSQPYHTQDYLLTSILAVFEELGKYESLAASTRQRAHDDHDNPNTYSQAQEYAMMAYGIESALNVAFCRRTVVALRDQARIVFDASNELDAVRAQIGCLKEVAS